MRIAVCDDEKDCIRQLMTVAHQYAANRTDMHISFESFTHPDDLMEAAEKIGGYDVYILDIVMPGTNGIALGTKLRESGYDGKIIYLTSSEEYSLDAFKVRAFDYIIKPITEQTFFGIMDEISELISCKKDKFIIIKSKERSIKIPFDSIFYAELNRRAITYYLAGGRTAETVSLRGTFTEAMTELLSDRRFNLCSVGMLVNLDHITEIESKAIVFGNTYRPFLGEKYCRKLRSVWSEYLFDSEV